MVNAPILTNPDSLKLHDLLELCNRCDMNQHGIRNINNIQNALQYSQAISYVLIDDKLISFGRLVSNGFRSEIQDIMTCPDHRRTGHASRIVLSLLEQAKGETPYVRLVDESGLENFYEKLGFEKPKPEKTYYKPL